MPINHKKITSLLEYIKIDEFYVSCHFRCRVTDKTIVSVVPFEPYDGKIEIRWQEMLLHPLKSYSRYYHTPITIYNTDGDETIVLKAFQKISKYFEWNRNYNNYVLIKKD
ncbi:MAG: hypothetical protein U9N33_10360 [Campylobacterota bacterium]|nr:hypothetical protein [Campylobacterota bacterium]